MKLFESEKGLDAIVDFGKGQDEPVCDGKILSVTLLFRSESFRMSKESFMKLCALLRPYLEKKVTHLRFPDISRETPSCDFVLLGR